jgi:hypothetical protein
MQTTAYTLLLKCLGLWFVDHSSKQIEFGTELKDLQISQNTIVEISDSYDSKEEAIEDEYKQENTTPRAKLIKRNYWGFLNIIYVAFIYFIISWKPIYKLININEYPHYMANAFIFIIPLQYSIERSYFNKTHFYKTLKSINCEKRITMYSKIILFTSCVTSLLSLVIYLETNMLDVYDTLKSTHNSLTNNILFALLCVLEHFYSNCIFFCSILSFSSVFMIHSILIDSFSESLDLENKENINKIITTYTELKSNYNDSVSYLNIMFSVTTVFGAIASFGVFVHIYKQYIIYDLFTLSYVVLYILAEIAYFYSIYKVRKSIERIRKTISSVSFTKKYLKQTSYQLSPTHTQTNIYIRNTSMCNSWIAMSMLVKTPWDSFTILGFTVENPAFIQKAFALLCIFLLTLPIRSYFDLHVF